VSALKEKYKDRKGGLVFFGIAQIVLGALCVLLAVITIAGAFMVKAMEARGGVELPQQDMAGASVIGVLFYLMLAVIFVWLGIGSIKARRWAQTLTLLFGWIWLIGGVMGLIGWLLIGPGMFAGLPLESQVPPQIMKTIMIMTGLFVAVIYIVIPGALVIFYGRQDVRLTCEARDLRESWTDKCPRSVLATSLLLAFCGIITPLSMWVYKWTCPFFGVFLHGLAGMVVYIATSLFVIALAYGLYCRRVWAWWAGLAFFLLAIVSVLMTFERAGLLEMYGLMGFSGLQLQVLYGMVGRMESWMKWMNISFIPLSIWYMVYIKKHFFAAPPAQSARHPKRR